MRKDRKDLAAQGTAEFQDTGLIGLETSDCLGYLTDSFISVQLAKSEAAKRKAEHAAWHRENDTFNKEDGRPTASQCHFKVEQIARIFRESSGGVEWRPL